LTFVVVNFISFLTLCIVTRASGAALSAVGNSSLIWGDNTLASNVRNSLVNNSVILYPVHSSLSNNNMPNSSTILGALVGSVNWEVFTAAVRQGSADAFDKSENYKLVLSNTCGQNSVYDSKHTTVRNKTCASFSHDERIECRSNVSFLIAYAFAD
jgi:hypothetical protein